MAESSMTMERQLEITRAISADLIESGRRHGASLELVCFTAAIWANVLAQEIASGSPQHARTGIAHALRQAADTWEAPPPTRARH